MQAFGVAGVGDENDQKLNRQHSLA